MKHTDIREIFAHTEAYLNGTVTVCGWVRTARDSKSVSFLEINDGTCFRNLQIVVDKTRIPEDMVRDAMAVGASVCAVGQLVASERNGCELELETLTVLGKCPADFPLQKKRHTLEYLRTIPHLRVRTRSFEAVFAAISWHRRCINTSTATATATFMPPSLPDRTARGRVRCSA